jgi:hypothetical protein
MREASRELALRAELIQVRKELSELLGELDHVMSKEHAAAAHASATVTAVVPKTILIPQRRLPR